MLLDVIVSISAFIVAGIGIVLYIVKLKTKGHETYERVERQGASPLVAKSVMEMGYWWFQAPGELLIKLNINPNQISWFSLLVGFLSGVIMAFGYFGIAAVLLLISSILDALDGYVARRICNSSAFGEILDSSLDRYVDFFFLGGLLIYYRESIFLMVITLFAILGSFMISYSSAKAEAMHVTPPRGSMKRSDRLVYLILGGSFASLSVAFWEQPIDTAPLGLPMVMVVLMIAVLSNVSAVHRLKSLADSVDKKDSMMQKKIITDPIELKKSS